MSRRLKIATITCLLIIVAVALVAWKRAGKPRYEGRTMEEWFNAAYKIAGQNQSSEADKAEMRRIESAFRHFGTNAVPYLAGRITQDFADSKLDKWLRKFRAACPQSMKALTPSPKDRGFESYIAAAILDDHVRPSAEQLLPLIQPALQSTDEKQRDHGLIALGGVSEAKAMAWPYILKEFEHHHPVIRARAAWVVTNFTQEASQSLTVIVRMACSNSEYSQSAIDALGRLGTNANAATPQLEKILASETDEQRRKALSSALKSIRGTTSANEQE